MTQGLSVFSFRRLLLALAVAMPTLASASSPAGTVLVVAGSARAVAADGTVRELARRAPVFAGERLLTGTGARVQVRFSDGSILALKGDTEIRVDRYQYEPKGAQSMLLSLVRGGFRTVTGAIGKLHREDYRIETPIATIGIRGTMHEAQFDPGEGLALAAWDGGTQACNSGGCLDLGVGADYRFGFVGLDGRREGRTTPPPGIGADDVPGADEAQALREPVVVRPLADEETGPRAAEVHDLLVHARPAYAGYVAVGGLIGSATEYPWGTARTLRLDDARVSVDGETGDVTAWSLRSALAGGYVNPGYAGAAGTQPPMAQTVPLQDPAAKVVWGTWSGVDTLAGTGDVSVGSTAGVATLDGIPAAGFFAFGTAPSNDVLASLAGRVSFDLLYSPDTPSTGFPRFFDANNAMQLQQASLADGYLTIDVGSGNVSGRLDFTPYFTTDSWHLVMTGNFANARLQNVRLVEGIDGSTTAGSWYQPAGATAGPTPLGVNGTLDAQLVGTASSLGLLGSFNVATIDTLDGNYANGLFLMQQAQYATYTGFAAVNGGGAYQWGNASLLVLDDARLEFGLDALGNTVVLDGAMYSSTAGNKYILPGRLNPDGVTASYPPQDPFWTALNSDPAVRIAWGGWLGGDMSLSDVDNGLWTNDAILDPGVFIFGDRPGPGVVAALAGTVDFTLLPQFPAFVDNSGIPQTGQSASGSMLLDVGSGMVNGDLSFQTASSDQWNLVFNGTFNAQASTPLNLALVSDAAAPANGSHLVSAVGAGGPLEVGGTIQADLVGLGSVAGVVGAFDVLTVDTVDNSQARGVFAMEVTPPALP